MLRRKSISLEIRPRRWLRKQKRRRKTCGEDAKEKSQERAAYAKEVVAEIKWVSSPFSRSSLSLPLSSPLPFIYVIFAGIILPQTLPTLPTVEGERKSFPQVAVQLPLSRYIPLPSPPPCPLPSLLPFSPSPIPFCIVLIFWSLSPFSCSVISCESKGMRSAAFGPTRSRNNVHGTMLPLPSRWILSLSITTQRNDATTQRNATQRSDAATQRDDATRRKAKGNDKRTPLAVVPWYG